MASRDFVNTQALDKEVKFLFGTVLLGASGAVSSQTSLGFTVSKPAGTGIYRVTLEDFYPELLFFGVTVLGIAAVDSFYQQQTAFSATSKVIDYQYMSGGSAANGVSGDSQQLMLVLKNSSVLP